MNRRAFLVAGAAGTGAVALGGLVPSARADVSEGELAYANFAVACEYLMADFYRRTLAAGLLHGSARNGADTAHRNEQEHVAALSTLLSDAGQSVPLADDFAFAWPKKTFASLGAAASAGARIEGAVVGAYTSAAATISVPSYRSLFARALVDESRHLAVLSWVSTGKPVGNAFPVALDLEEATDIVEPYLG